MSVYHCNSMLHRIHHYLDDNRTEQSITFICDYIIIHLRVIHDSAEGSQSLDCSPPHFIIYSLSIFSSISLYLPLPSLHSSLLTSSRLFLPPQISPPISLKSLSHPSLTSLYSRSHHHHVIVPSVPNTLTQIPGIPPIWGKWFNLSRLPLSSGLSLPPSIRSPSICMPVCC